MTAHLNEGREIIERLDPNLEDALRAKFEGVIPGFTDSLVEWAYGRHYARPGLDMKTRQLCTVAALTALGGQTGPQLKANIRNTLSAGASQTEVAEAIWQMAVYGGLPAAINGLSAAIEVFAENETVTGC